MHTCIEKEKTYLVKDFSQFKNMTIINDWYIMESDYLFSNEIIEKRLVKIKSDDYEVFRLDTKIRNYSNDGIKVAKKEEEYLTYEDYNKILLSEYVNNNGIEYTIVKKQLDCIDDNGIKYCLQDVDNGILKLVEVECDNIEDFNKVNIIGKDVSNDRYYYMSEYYKRKKERLL